jgi:hypothetical protein
MPVPEIWIRDHKGFQSGESTMLCALYATPLNKASFREPVGGSTSSMAPKVPCGPG